MPAHNLPDDLNPTGVLTVPLSIPNDSDWVELLIGAIRQLSTEDYYQLQDHRDSDIFAVNDIWRKVTIVPLIESLANLESCSGGGATVEKLAVSAVRTANFIINAGVSTPITFPSTKYDYGLFHNLLTANEFIVPSGKAGIYTLFCGAIFSGATLGRRQIAIRKNGVAVAFEQISTATIWGASLVYEDELVAGDVVDMTLFSDATVTILAAIGSSCYFSMSRKFE